MTVSRAEDAITVAWTEILHMCDDDDAAAVRALGASAWEVDRSQVSVGNKDWPLRKIGRTQEK